MRLNAIMALISVVCVTGVVSSELIGPVAHLRSAPRDEDDAGADKRPALRAELADDAFQFPSSELPFLMEVLGPKPALGPGQRRTLPLPAFSPVSMLLGNEEGGDEVTLADAAGLPGSLALTDASFTSSSGSTPSSSFSPPGPSLFDSAPINPVGGKPPPSTPPGTGSSGSPPPSPPPIGTPVPVGPLPSATPEPESWLLLVLGLGGAGSVLRLRRTAKDRSPDEDAPERIRN